MRNIIVAMVVALLLSGCESIDLGITLDRSPIDASQILRGVVVNVADNSSVSKVRMSDRSLSLNLIVCLNKASEGSVRFNVGVDADYVNTYNKEHGTDYTFFPGAIVLSAETIEIGKGSARSEDVSVVLRTDASMTEDQEYLLPISVSGDDVTLSDEHFLLFVSDVRNSLKSTDKGVNSVKSVVYVEVNNVNPLNALEFRLEKTGKLFFDHVVLFSANINYDKTEKRVYLKCNQNIQYLLDHSDEYIRPLQDKGIKVILSVLGNHDEAGVAQLSKAGAMEFAKELAAYCNAYALDGVGFDDEYSDSPDLSNPWLTYTSTDAAARLLYETKKAMPEKIVMAYYLNNLNASLPSVDGMKPGSFIDYVVPDYAGSVPAAPMIGMTKADCAGASINLTNGGGGSSERELAKNNKNAGYGYYMFYNLDPSLYSIQIDRISNISIGLYNSGIKAPSGYYKYRQTTLTNL